MTSQALLPAIALILAATLWLIRRHHQSQLLRYPPGPRAYPFIGNILDFPRAQWWLKFESLAHEFGPLVHLQIANRHILLLNDLESVKSVMDSVNNADRPRFIMAGELMGFDPSIAFINYCERWRIYRRISHKVMSKVGVKQYIPFQEKEACRLIGALILNPEEYRAQLRFSVGRTIVHAMYGVECPTPNDPYIRVAEETLTNITYAVIPGSYMVDVFPLLRYMPYIGLHFQRKIREAQHQVKLMVQDPYNHVIRERARGSEVPCFTSALLDGDIDMDVPDKDEWDSIVSWASATMYGAAGETTQATMLNFILAMMLHPNIQSRAQEELDAVVGKDRLPLLSDLPALPYVSAILKEVLRWRVPLPLGVPHQNRQGFELQGYWIPAGTILVPNIWAISRDPSRNESPLAFNPDRHLQGDKDDPTAYAFGFGPRVCVGKNFALNQSFIFMSTMLWAFRFEKALDANNEEILPSMEYTTGFVSQPLPFACKIVPRGDYVAKLVGVAAQE
ncbi:cytochrome P450 [Mycena floridula]|nr:cytochrome P450 [Mycena floridula]